MPQTLLPAPRAGAYRVHYSAYGLGWFLRDVLGYKEVSHTGGLPGMASQVTLLPEQHLGIIVLTNQNEGFAMRFITNFVEDCYLGESSDDLFDPATPKLVRAYYAKQDSAVRAVWQQVARAQKATSRRPTYAPYVGRYHDAWLGDLTLATQDRRLWLRVARSPRLVGEVLPYQGSTYVVRWRDPGLLADAFVTFALDEQGQATGLKIKLLSESSDPSYDFSDLDVQRMPLP